MPMVLLHQRLANGQVSRVRKLSAISLPLVLLRKLFSSGKVSSLQQRPATRGRDGGLQTDHRGRGGFLRMKLATTVGVR